MKDRRRRKGVGKGGVKKAGIKEKGCCRENELEEEGVRKNESEKRLSGHYLYFFFSHFLLIE